MTRPQSRPEFTAARIRRDADLLAAFANSTGTDPADYPEPTWDERAEAQMDLAAATADEYGRPDRRAWAARIGRRWTR